MKIRELICAKFQSVYRTNRITIIEMSIMIMIVVFCFVKTIEITLRFLNMFDWLSRILRSTTFRKVMENCSERLEAEIFKQMKDTMSKACNTCRWLYFLDLCIYK